MNHHAEALTTQSLNETTNEILRSSINETMNQSMKQSFKQSADYHMTPIVMLAIMYLCCLMDLYQPYQAQPASPRIDVPAEEQKERAARPGPVKDRVSDQYMSERTLQVFFIVSLFVQHYLGLRYIAWRISECPYDPVSGMEMFGFVLVIFGAALRVWARVTLGRLFTYLVSVREGHRLVTSGPYQWMIHPSYTGAMMVWIGYALFTHSIGAAVAMTALGGYWLSLRVPNEEKVLAHEFGQAFMDRQKTVARFIPYVF